MIEMENQSTKQMTNLKTNNKAMERPKRKRPSIKTRSVRRDVKICVYLTTQEAEKLKKHKAAEDPDDAITISTYVRMVALRGMRDARLF